MDVDYLYKLSFNIKKVLNAAMDKLINPIMDILQTCSIYWFKVIHLLGENKAIDKDLIIH